MAKTTNVRTRTGIKLKKVEPKTDNQELMFEKFDSGKHLFTHGWAGTGKTFIGMYLALDALLVEKTFKELVIIRSCVPARAQGFLPGTAEEKDAIFEVPFEEITNDILQNDAAYNILKGENRLRFLSTSYLRGLTLTNSIIIVDEIQDMNWGEINTVMTRTGSNCRLLISGDTAQNDLKYLHQDTCIDEFRKIIPRMSSFGCVEMGFNDIVRDGLVKEWLMAVNS